MGEFSSPKRKKKLSDIGDHFYFKFRLYHFPSVERHDDTMVFMNKNMYKHLSICALVYKIHRYTSQRGVVDDHLQKKAF